MAAPRVLGVAEIVLNVRELPKVRDFYRDLLGFRVLDEACHEAGSEPDPEGEPTITFMTVTDVDTPLGRRGHPQLLVLIDPRRHVFARDRFDRVAAATSTLNHIAFEIPPGSYGEHRRLLEARGLEPREASFPSMSARALFFDDPEGNLIELICHAAGEEVP